MIRKHRILLVVAIIIAAICIAGACGCADSNAREIQRRADLIEISNMRSFGPLERPPVVFPHDLHTMVLQLQGKDCSTCHLTKANGHLSQKFLRLNGESRDSVMATYHDNCIACHTELKDKGLAAGPVTCGGCHDKKPPFVSTRKYINFDKSLHYRHLKANNDSCALCHHQYDEATGKLVYVKGDKYSCRDCHGDERVNQVDPNRLASHDLCITCHRNLAAKNVMPDGPVHCDGCHDPQIMATYPKLENVPRLDIDQPDYVLLSTDAEELTMSKLPTVPFPHKDHEAAIDDCRICHHQTMKPCNECHLLDGHKSEGGVTLRQAMHYIGSDHSCIGCHDHQKDLPECAGCHDLRAQEVQSERACTICHAGVTTEHLTERNRIIPSLKAYTKSASQRRLSFAPRDIPDTVDISVLKKKYDSVKMPHKKHIETILAKIRGNRIAEYFHGEDDIMCQGCHHHSPVGERPPLCESCHGDAFNPQTPFKPGMQGAYHRLCLGCHESMNNIDPSDCKRCHGDTAPGKAEPSDKEANQ